MRKPLGVLALVLGVGGLGLWARAYNAHEIEQKITAEAAGIVAPAIHGITSTVSGRDITAKGIADTEAEKSGILAALNGLPGRRVVHDQITVLPKVSPYEMSLTKAEGAEALTAAGSVPSEAFRKDIAALPGHPDPGPLVLASGAPADWDRLVKAAAAALQPLDFGTASLTDDRLVVTGQARTPAEADLVHAALQDLAADRVEVRLDLLDDGTPPEWHFSYDAFSGAQVSGKLPVGLDEKTISAATGIPSVYSPAHQALIGEPGHEAALLGVLAPWFPSVERLNANMAPGKAEIFAEVGPGSNTALLTETLQSGMKAISPELDVSVTVQEVAPRGDEGEQRTNAITGQTEELRGGYWLPVANITPSLTECTAQADAILGRSTINFVSGSDQLSADARAVINQLASVVLPCTGTGGLQAKIGGHTDATGDAEMNLGLSQRRAVAVRKELIARGIPAGDLRAQGYGASQPVATNDTEEGKAANRRTTIEWTGEGPQ
ncbi:OmpA family protein [Xinfangfangia sp. D13-10-4-6]|uniref:OmpA family protein n=1 Tax=Pseudogemmobacter hezensis TaxID=2737662 RepID=UPI001553C4ED|nr:OmpA family protein [Pseudogemmobacter hezensis]NPD16418.1 OmpA family protein [Pseudogemmobacter hezensis]